ncbi:hypothetical protein K457DRAFT_573165 [Linnemannia elongata AG-77]|uniref:Uncharacterized protein n=1 Tax=Linnemannia elongata AG-77 TaxID=1314771 RepID=A0A197KDU4_9FUNG|nr:hypothetical protein K457DRAFT_573165 [Linnemannia elongata AG-77]
MDSQVAKRHRLDHPIVSHPSSPSLPSPSSSSLRSLLESPSTSPTPMAATIVTGPGSGKTMFFKWKGRGPQCELHRNNDDNYIDDDDKTVLSDDDGEEDGYSSDGAASLAATQKDVWSAYSDDNEDKDDRAASTMVLADYDAGDLKTPIYSTTRTPGTAMWMFNGVNLEGGNSIASPSSPARSVGWSLPQKLTDYEGFQDAWAEINEMAAFEEDLEYAGLHESIEEFLTRMHERKRKSEFAQGSEFEDGPEYADAIWVPFEQPDYKHLDGDKTPTDDTNGNRTIRTRGSNSSSSNSKKDVGDSQLIDMGTYVDYPSGDEYSDLEFWKAMKNDNKASKGTDNRARKEIDNDNPSTSCTDNYDSDSTAGWESDDSDQDTIKGGNTAGDYLDEKDLEISGIIGTTDKTGGITGSGCRYDYEDEVDYGEDDDLFD